MTLSRRIAPVILLSVTLFAMTVSLRDVHAAEPTGLTALAGPLAEQFGVPANLVTGLLENGVSLESVTQLLLVSESSDKSLDDVTKVYDESGKKIDDTAAKLDVAATEYSPKKVSAAIDEA